MCEGLVSVLLFLFRVVSVLDDSKVLVQGVVRAVNTLVFWCLGDEGALGWGKVGCW